MATHPYLDVTGPIPFAHRGGAREWPENTIEAFAGAYELGFRYLETDVHLSADGVVVAFHDPLLDRVADAAGGVRDLDWPELAEVRINESGRIPSLEYLLEQFPDARFNIDMKSDEVVEPLVKLVSELGAMDRVCLASFHERRIRKARSIAGAELCTSAGISIVAANVFRSLRIPMPLGRAHVMQIPIRRYGVKVATQRFIDTAHALGKVVHVWTIDEPEEIHRLLDMGVDGIMTDKPSVLKSVFEERGIWKQPG